MLKDELVPHCHNANGTCEVCNNPKTRMINPKAYLNKFNEEYVNDKLNRKNLKKNLHNTQELKKDCDDRNNARNRCQLTTNKAAGKMIDYEKISERDYMAMSPEDQMILKEEIDIRLKRRRKRNS